ncbi:TRAP transporter small permease subunit [Fulvimarina sp. MAC8]|uniref:TRAP transporter small permease n=1 Tax=Fulvimarina sp. MAC8 TaxID=3162874 RepID=UPI0032ED5A75
MRKLVRWTGSAWLSLSVVLLVGTIVTVLCQVAFRYVIALPLSWTEEAARIFLVTSVYAALPAAYVRGEHIVVDFFVTMMPPGMLRVYLWILKLLTALVSLYFAAGALLQAEATRNMTFISLPTLSVSVLYVVQGAAMIFLALLVLVTMDDREVYIPTEHEGIDA